MKNKNKFKGESNGQFDQTGQQQTHRQKRKQTISMLGFFLFSCVYLNYNLQNLNLSCASSPH